MTAHWPITNMSIRDTGRKEALVEHEDILFAEELLRLLALSASASRLYPPSSPMPEQAIAKFVDRSNEIVEALGTIQLGVNPDGFIMGNDTLTGTQAQMAWLAETLHSMQVGQLIVSSGVTHDEVRAFVHVVNSDPVSVRQRGVRSLLTGAGVTHIAVIEVTLRSSTEEGILGLDLTSAPIAEISQEAVAAVELWSDSARSGSGRDDLREAIDRLEAAARDLALTRIAAALMQVDEHTRLKLIGMSLELDLSGRRMTGLHNVLSRLQPSALARLLTLAATSVPTDPARMVSALELPPSLMDQVFQLLSPSPRSEEECGVPEDPEIEEIARVMASQDNYSDIQQLSAKSSAIATSKALQTTVAISRITPSADSVIAIGEALVPAARQGSFNAVREAINRLDELASIPALALEIEQAKSKMHDPEILLDLCRATSSNADAAMAGEILRLGGAAGAEVLLLFLGETNDHTRSLFRPVARTMGEQLLTAAGRLVKTGDAPALLGILKALSLMADDRSVPVIVQAMNHLDAQVRRTAVTTLADMPGSKSKSALAGAASHWDPETRRFAIREIARAKATEAIPALVRILLDINIFERNHELKKEVIKCLESLGSPEAQRPLKLLANRRFVFGRQNKELRYLANQALARISETLDRDKGANIDER